jgi:hypothetical protein
MNEELFKIEPVKSPRLKWMERHHITVTETANEDNEAVFQARHGMTVIAEASTVDKAIHKAAKSLNIKLWNEEAP